MEAILEKKPPKMTGRWSSRLFRLKDRRLMYFKKDVIDFNKAIDSSAKYSLDLTHLISLTIDKKHDNVLIIKHPRLDIALRFSSNTLFMSWLKVLSSFSYKLDDRNGPSIETSIPSNYLYSIWNVLQSLYSHPLLNCTEGIFRISANKNEKKLMLNNLLQQTYNVQKLRNYSNIHILANVLSALLSNLPSTIFGETLLESLIEYYDEISNRTSTKKNIFHFNDKHKYKHIDDDIKNINIEILNKLKLKIEHLYLKRRNRYGLMTLIFHLLKQIIIAEINTKMTAESLSRIFVDILESKIFLIKLSDPMKMFRMQYLVKTLIYHAYHVFPEQQWQIKDIVIAQKCEIATINLYNQFCKIRIKNKTEKWRHKFSKKEIEKKKSIRALKQPSTTIFISHFKNPNYDDIKTEERASINRGYKSDNTDHKTARNDDDSSTVSTVEEQSSDSNSMLKHIRIRGDSDINRSDPDIEFKRRLSRVHKHSRHASDSLAMRGITVTNTNTNANKGLQLLHESQQTSNEDADDDDDDDAPVSPVDVLQFVSNINMFKKKKNDKDYFGKRHTDPPSQIQIKRNHINDTLYNMKSNGFDIDPIPSGHSKNDTIVTSPIVVPSIIQSISPIAMPIFGVKPPKVPPSPISIDDDSIDYKAIMDQVHIMSDDDDDDGYYATNNKNDYVLTPLADDDDDDNDDNDNDKVAIPNIEKISSINSEQWLQNIFDEIVDEI